MTTASLWTPRTLAAAIVTNSTVFIQTCAVVSSQLFAFFLLPFSRAAFYDYLAYLMRQWVHLLVGLLQYFAPSTFILTMDSSCDGTDIVTRDKHGGVSGLSFPKRIIVTSNHQIYADWIYIWLIAFHAKAHGSLKIILKHSLVYLPVFGLVHPWSKKGMQIFDFIFLKRKLAFDKDTIVNNLERSKRFKIPMWLLLFPEGTVISEDTRQRSKNFAKKNDMSDNRFTLLPRSTGLKLILETLGDDPEWMYDFTIGYSGVKATDIPEKVYTIRSIFSQGWFPRQIHVYVRRFRIPDIPLHDDNAFSKWMFDRWAEKDNMMAHFYQEGSFAAKEGQEVVELPIRLQNPVSDIGKLYLMLIPYIPLCILAWKVYSILCSA